MAFDTGRSHPVGFPSGKRRARSFQTQPAQPEQVHKLSMFPRGLRTAILRRAGASFRVAGRCSNAVSRRRILASHEFHTLTELSRESFLPKHRMSPNGCFSHLFAATGCPFYMPGVPQHVAELALVSACIAASLFKGNLEPHSVSICHLYSSLSNGLSNRFNES